MTERTGPTGPAMDPFGSTEDAGIRVVPVEFERFLVYVFLTPKNEFAGIAGVAVREDFRSQRQKIAGQGVHNVSDLYED